MTDFGIALYNFQTHRTDYVRILPKTAQDWLPYIPLDWRGRFLEMCRQPGINPQDVYTQLMEASHD